MTADGPKLNGKAGWIAAVTGIPLAVFATWIFSTGVVKGTIVERVSQLERRVNNLERVYEQTSVSINKIQVKLAKIGTKLGVE